MSDIPGIFRRRKTGLIFAAILVLCIFMILFSNRNVVLKPKAVGQTVFSGFQIALHSVGRWFGNTWNSIGELKRLQEDLARTREKLLEYERVSRTVADLRRENETLRSQLDFSRAIPFDQIAAEVIARDPGNEFSTISVNKGSAHGVQRGMPVIALQQGLQGLVGKVVSVGLITSTIKPITDPTSYVSARLQHSRYDGLVRGRQLRRGSLIMQYVNKLAAGSIQYGELVITSGMGQLFPKGINIGRVREIQSKTYEASLEMELEPIIDFSQLEYLFILKSGE